MIKAFRELPVRRGYHVGSISYVRGNTEDLGRSAFVVRYFSVPATGPKSRSPGPMPGLGVIRIVRGGPKPITRERIRIGNGERSGIRVRVLQGGQKYIRRSLDLTGRPSIERLIQI